MDHADAVAALTRRTPAAQRSVLAALPPEYHPPDATTDIYTVGFECEIANRPTGLLTALVNARLTNATRFHGYHCRCADTCANQTVDIHPQDDGTCRGELISRILHWPTPETSVILERLAQVLAFHGVNPISNPATNGFHVHVGKPGDWTPQDHATLVHIFAAYQRDVSQLATHWRPMVRRYNHPITHQVCFNESANVNSSSYSLLSKGFWLSDRGNTYEFRMWNGVQAAWRMRMNIGVSVAFMRAARAHSGWRCSQTRTIPASLLTAEPGYHTHNAVLPVAKRGAGGFLDVVGPHMDDVVLADVLRQLDHRSKVQP